MKILLYIFLTKVRQVLLLTLFVFAPIIVLEVVFLSRTAHEGLLTNFALATGFLCVLITASTLRPEDTASLEMMACLSRPFWQTIAITVILCFLVVWWMGGLAAFIAMLSTSRFDPGLLMAIAAGYAAVVLFFGGVTFLGIIKGRDSRIGLMVGLIAVVWMLAFPGIFSRVATVPAMPLFNIVEAKDNPVLWGVYRFVYSLIGIGCGWVGIRWLRDTDYLLIGALRRGRRLVIPSDPPKHRRRGWHRWLSVMSRPLSISVSKNIGLVIYEGMVSVIKGPIPIAIAVMWLILGCIVIWDLWNLGFWFAMEEGATSLLFSLRLFLAVLLPFVLIVTVTADRRTHIDQVMLSLLSPRAYLGGKLLGICAGVFVSFLVWSLPAFLFMTISALMGQPIYLAGYLGNLFLGVFPFLTYMLAVSVFTGMLARSGHSLLWGGFVAIGILAAFFTTAKSIIGNLIFPLGQMVADTIAYPIYLHAGISFNIPDPRHFLLVPVSYLALPMLSAALQVVLMWLLASKIYERQVRSI